MNHLISNCVMVLNGLGDRFCDYAGRMFVQAGVLIAALWIVDLVIRKRVRATFRYWLWMLVFVKLLLPPTLSLPSGLGYWFGGYLPDGSIAVQQYSDPAQLNPAPEPVSSPIAQAPYEPITAPVSDPPITTVTIDSSVAPRLNALTWEGIVFGLWIFGVLVITALLVQRMFFVRRLIAQSEPVTSGLVEMLDQCRRQLRLRRNVQLRLSHNVASPAACGLFRPVILMPKGIAEKLSQEKLRAVLIHELAHVKRGDLWINCAQTILQILYFYHPLVWLANVVVRRVREQAVDEMVLVALGAEAKSYSRTLIDVAEMAFAQPALGLRLVSVVESKKALHGRIRHMVNRPIPKSVKLGILGLTTVLVLGMVLLPMAKAQKQSADSTLANPDPDKDGLENELEAELGTNPKSSDTDSDGLCDYDEYCKYRTDPAKKDSDADGKPDGDWDERREYAYSIRAICEIRPPSSLEMINDLYQDARPVEKKAALDDARVVEVLIFPFAEAHVYAQPFPKENLDKELREYIQPTTSMNFSPETKKKVGDIVRDAATDVEAIEKMLHWMDSETTLAREMPHWEYLNIINGKIVWHQSLGSSERDKQFLETNFLGDSMFKKKVHGTCSSTAILRGMMFRAAGLPTRLIQTLPLMTRYSEDPEPLADRLRMREMANGYAWGPGNGGANHTYNEVFLNHRWVRVDNSIGTGPFVGDTLFVKAWSSADWNNLKEEWNAKRCFRALDVSDARPKYKGKSAGTVDVVVKDSELSIKENPNGSFDTVTLIHNRGSEPSPQFRVNFYAGDPDKGGRLLSEHGAGPIMPHNTWGERDPGLILNPDENSITVMIDPDNRVDEADETNNKASVPIPGKQLKKPAETDTLNQQTTQTEAKVGPKETEKASREVSGIDISPTHFDIRLDKNRETCDLVVSIQNRSNITIPRFKLRFYRGDPSKNLDEAGNEHEGWHGAGPIEPGKEWGERTNGFHLPDGQYEFSVCLDCDNTISEIDENNNRAELKVRIENDQIADKSVTCPSNSKTAKPNVQVEAGKSTSSSGKAGFGPVDFEGYFQDSIAGGQELEQLWNDRNKDLRDADEILTIVRKGLRRYRGSGNILGWIGNLFIWGKSPQNPKAIELMYHASGSPERHLYGDAIYFGLSVTENKTPEILRAMTTVAMKTDDYYNVTGRILWGCRNQKAELIACLEPYLDSDDTSVRQKAQDVKDYFTDSKAFMDKRAKQHEEAVKQEYGDRLGQFKDRLLNGSSQTRLDTLKQLNSEGIMSIVDESFLDAFEACTKDSDPQVRTLSARTMGNKFVWDSNPQNQQAIEILTRLLDDHDRETRGTAVYFGLSTVRSPTKELVKKMLATILDDREISYYGRIIWGIRRNKQACVEVLREWMDQSERDSQRALKAYEIYEDVTAEQLPQEYAKRFAGRKSDAHEGVVAMCFQANPISKEEFQRQFLERVTRANQIQKVLDFYIIETRETAVGMFVCTNLADRNAMREALMKDSAFQVVGYVDGRIGPTGSGWIDSLKNFREQNKHNRVALRAVDMQVKIENAAVVPQGTPDSPPNIFVMEPSQSTFGIFDKVISLTQDWVWNKTGHQHSVKAYDEIFDGTHSRSSNDVLVMIFSLDREERIPAGYEDLLPKSWAEIEADLTQGRNVELLGKARNLNVILIAAPSMEQLEKAITTSKFLNNPKSFLKTSGKGCDIGIEEFKINPEPDNLLYYAVASIRNYGTAASPAFLVSFCRDVPGGARPIHGAGPIEPDKTWNERSSSFGLKEGVNEISVVLDPADMVEESDESNNRAVLRVVVRNGQIVEK